jgi:hypothetical protein
MQPREAQDAADARVYERYAAVLQKQGKPKILPRRSPRSKRWATARRWSWNRILTAQQPA